MMTYLCGDTTSLSRVVLRINTTDVFHPVVLCIYTCSCLRRYCIPPVVNFAHIYDTS